MGRAVHLADPDAVLVTRLARALCGRGASSCTEEPSAVTCGDCLRLHAQRTQTGRREVRFEEALRSIARLIAGPPILPVPALTPEAWARMRCRIAVAKGEHSAGPTTEPWIPTVAAQTLNLHCRCDACVVELDNAKTLYEWNVEQEQRPHRAHEHEFGSTRAALDLLARWRRDGGSTRSSLGSAQARAEETMRLGTAIQTTRIHGRDAIEIRRSGMAADIERACRRAFAEPAARRGQPLDVCVAILLDSVTDGPDAEWWAEQTGLTERSLRALVRHGLKQVTVELAVGEYIPAPRSAAGLDEAIQRRRAEIDAATTSQGRKVAS